MQSIPKGRQIPPSISSELGFQVQTTEQQQHIAFGGPWRIIKGYIQHYFRARYCHVNINYYGP
jgi:hypothetical protein